MSTFRQMDYQVVFSTKNRESTIAEQYEQELYKYTWGIIKNLSANYTGLTVCQIIFISFQIYIRPYV